MKIFPDDQPSNFLFGVLLTEDNQFDLYLAFADGNNLGVDWSRREREYDRSQRHRMIDRFRAEGLSSIQALIRLHEMNLPFRR